jgi:CubicO group peptidase (beta-lactamase class C family)
LGFITLAKIVEQVTGKGFDVYCKEEIFIPLQMNSTFFNPPDSLLYKIAPTEYDNYWRHKLVWGKVHDETASLLNGVAGHAGLFSTTKDVSNLLQMLLDRGRYKNIQLIKPETVKIFTTRYSDKSTRALGWDTKSKENSSAGNLFDITSFGHTGFTGTSVWIDPTRKLFVVFLTNRVYPTRENKKLYKVRPILHNAVINALD